jgi:hypothetical protein
MSIALIVVLGIAAITSGAGVTFMLASALPQDVLQPAQENGRYAGLSADDQGESTEKRTAASGSKPRGHSVHMA